MSTDFHIIDTDQTAWETGPQPTSIPFPSLYSYIQRCWIDQEFRGTSTNRYTPLGNRGESLSVQWGGGDGFTPDLSDLRRTSKSDVENASQYNGESVREMCLKAKNWYDDLVCYFSGQRQQWIEETHKKSTQAQIVARSLEFVDPESRLSLQQLIAECQPMIDEDVARVQHLDDSVDEETRQGITYIGMARAVAPWTVLTVYTVH